MTTFAQTDRRTLQVNLKRTATMGLLLGGLLLSACSSTETPVVTPTVTSVAVTGSATALNIGATKQLTATVTGTNSPAMTVTWASSNTAVATVNASGLVTAVAAGTATITATSTVDTTKRATFAVTVNAAASTFQKVSVSFRPATGGTTALPAGFVADTGMAYSATTGSGWVTQDTAGTASEIPLDFTGNTRDRAVAGVAPEQNTFIHLQYTGAGAGSHTPGAWEYNVPNGTYNVTVSVGDAATANLDSSDTINVEGTAAISGFVPTASAPFKTATVQVSVTDGKLTVDAKGGTNTKLNYVIIAP